MRRVRSLGKNIELPKCAHPRRRKSCRLDLVRFARIYFKHIFYTDFCPEHISVLMQIQDRILHGGSKALAAPRGWGKDSLFKVAVIWAILYGHCKYLVYVGPKQEFAESRLMNIKAEFERHAPLLLEDFPEAVIPIRALEGATQRGATQTVHGERTFIHWGQKWVRFPVVEGSECSGALIQACGILEGNRGFNLDNLRPDFLALNDLEDDDIARSDVQRKTYERVIDQALGGIAGQGKRMSSFILCTIISRECLSFLYTDPRKKPAWSGSRLKSVIKMPDNEDLWETYVELWREGKGSQLDEHTRWANAFYLVNRAEMDAGAEVIWEDNYIRDLMPDGTPEENSALQHIYNKIADKGETYFLSELQNDPPEISESASGQLTDKKVRESLSGYPQGIVPDDAPYLVEGIDLGGREIHWTVCAFQENGTPFIVDYGRIMVAEIMGDVEFSKGKEALEKELLRALRMHRLQQEGGYKDSQGEDRQVGLTLVDGGWLPDVAHKWAHEGGRRYRVTKGCGSVKGQGRFNAGVPGDNVRPDFHHTARKDTGKGWWRYDFDADFWKEYTHRRFLQSDGTIGAATCYGNDPREHRSYAKHIISEKFDVEQGRFIRNSRHNHYLDTTVLCMLAGAMLGVRLHTEEMVAPPKPKAQHRAISMAPAPKRGGTTTRMRRMF